MKYKMVKLLLFLSLIFSIVFIAPSAQAYSWDSWSMSSLGGTDFYSYDDGDGTGTWLGNTYFYDDSYGWSGGGYSLGNTDFYNYYNFDTGSSLNGSSYKLGSTTFYDFYDDESNSINGSSFRLGSTDFYDFGDDDYSCSWLGSTYFCN